NSSHQLLLVVELIGGAGLLLPLGLLRQRVLLSLLQCLDKRGEARVGVLAGCLGRQVLGDVRRRHVHLPQERRHGVEARVVVHVEVDLGQELEGLDAAVGHLDVLVHAAPPDERRVQLLHVVGGEHDDALTAARGPQPVDEVEHAGERHLAAARLLVLLLLVLLLLLRRSTVLLVLAVLLLLVLLLALASEVERAVDVLDDDDGLAGGLDEELAKVGVGAHGRELDVVHVVVEVVGHGGDHGGLAGPRRPVQEVAALPRLADARVVVLAVAERVQVVHHLLLLVRVHGQRRERLGVLEHHVAPNTVGPQAGASKISSEICLPSA
uniref:Uncharacterized protein n=1 Tax=Zea mays TaxID=4577 RepID=A0A804Q659_MAIZE